MAKNLTKKQTGQVITTFKHDDTKTVVYKVTKNSLINEYSMVGRLNTMHSNNKNPNNIDMVDLMDALTPTAINLLKMIKDKAKWLHRNRGKFTA